MKRTIILSAMLVGFASSAIAMENPMLSTFSCSEYQKLSSIASPALGNLPAVTAHPYYGCHDETWTADSWCKIIVTVMLNGNNNYMLEESCYLINEEGQMEFSKTQRVMRGQTDNKVVRYASDNWEDKTFSLFGEEG